MYPKSKSPSETKYERLRGMCSGAGENVRYIPIDNGIQQHGRAWRYMVGAVCISAYSSMAAGQHGMPTVQGQRQGREKHGIPMQQGIYLCTICEHSIQPPSPELRNARVRVSRARACVILLYYYIIIILLYYYIYIYPIYPVYPIYPTMVI